MANPYVTILMGTWNRAAMLPKTIQSIREQSFTDWELVVPDDGSTDTTPQVMEAWTKKDPRIVYVRNSQNQGISKNYNTGLRRARGEYVAMIDDDDPWCDPQKLEKQIAFLDTHSEYVGCGGGVIVVDGGGKPGSEVSAGSVLGGTKRNVEVLLPGNEKYRYLKPETDSAIRARMLFSNPMANSTTMFRRAVGEAVGWYDESTRYAGDRDFWMKLGLRGKLYNFPEYFSFYTMTGANTSIAKLRPHLKASLMIMRRYKGKYPGYFPALLLNQLQYTYSFLPEALRRVLHTSLARLKRAVAG